MASAAHNGTGNGTCVIMAGGRGTRFWPVSRTALPKQLLPLAGDTSLLRQTCDRVLPLVGADRLLVITSGDLAAACRRELPELSPDRVVAEPVGRNTAPCAVLGVGLARRIAGDGAVALLPADHHIPDGEVFREQLGRAFGHAATTDAAVTFGIPPTRAETGYGYLQIGEESAGEFLPGVAFVEKPDRQRAEEYLRGGRHLWNSGIFVWNAAAFADAAVRFVPGIADRLAPAIAAYETPAFADRLAAAYADCPSESVDCAIMEHLERFTVLRAGFRWSDLGGWEAWGELAATLPDGNRGRGDLIAVASGGNVIHAPDQLVALVGVEDLIVVATPDALLICRRDEAARIREIVSRLEDDGRDALL
jgi:mannose-1-phosphate guanylyltransferase